MKLDPQILARVAGDTDLWPDFESLCDFGGRLSGTPSERASLDWLKRRGAEAMGVLAKVVPVPYGGWTAKRAELVMADGRPAACHPLVRTIATPPGGLSAEVIDIGRGTPEEFEAHRDEIAGRIVLVRHELMFAAGTVHRRRKYDAARAAGAVGFLIAGPLNAGLVTGSSGRNGAEGIPGLGITPETAARLRPGPDGRPTVRMIIETDEAPAETETLLFDLPGTTDEWVVLSAHVDGHDLAESAMDNASGVATALAAARALAPVASKMRRGLRLAFFSVEEWALTGSAQYVEAMSAEERSRIALNVNLDTVGGSAHFTALTSGFAGLDPFLQSVAGANGFALRAVRPLMTNSDHANFAMAGIPALRLVAGFDDPAAGARHVLTPADTRDKVAVGELRIAAIIATALTAAGCAAEDASVWRA